MRSLRTLALAVLALAAAGALAPAASRAATFTPDRVDLAAAKREGVVSW